MYVITDFGFDAESRRMIRRNIISEHRSGVCGVGGGADIIRFDACCDLRINIITKYNLKIMNRFFYFVIFVMTCFFFLFYFKCRPPEIYIPVVPDMSSPKLSWQDEFRTEILRLGHRNWIVVVDMAYPLQTQPGIKTVYTDGDYLSVLRFVYGEIGMAAHVKATVYQDSELVCLDEKDAAGIDVLREQMNALFGDCRTFVPHEELIERLDEASRMFNVVILKSNLTVPYTSTFFELDCNYWDSDREQSLRERLSQRENDRS
jgi:hypothetical protein